MAQQHPKLLPLRLRLAAKSQSSKLKALRISELDAEYDRQLQRLHALVDKLKLKKKHTD